LAMLYFHQFPNYFLLANIIIITITPVIMGCGLAVLAFSFWGFAYKYLSLALMYMIKFMNWTIVFIEELPYSLTGNIYLSPIETILVYVTILLFACAFLYKNRGYLFYALSCAILVVGMDISIQIPINKQQEINFYSLRSGYVIDVIEGRNAILLGDSINLNDPQAYDFNIKNNHINHRIKYIEKTEGVSYFQFQGKSILILNKPVYAIPQQEKLQADYVLLNGNFNISLDDLMEAVDFKMLISDGSYSYYRIENISKACAQKAVPYHDLKNQGALSVKWR